MDYDTKVLPLTGGYGRYNRIVVVFSWLPNFAVMLNLFSDVFYTLIPESYHCRPDPELLPSTRLPGNLSMLQVLNLSVPWVEGSGLSRCHLYRLQSNFVTEWNLVCSDYWKIPVQQICFMIGWILGYVFLGTLCDWLGRRRVFLLSISLSCVLGVAVCLSSSAEVFLLLRLLQGSTLAGVFLSSYIASKCSLFSRIGFIGLFQISSLAVCHHTDPSGEEEPSGILQKERTHFGLTAHRDDAQNARWPVHPWMPARFIGTGIQYCFTRNLHRYSHNFYFTYFLRVLTGAVACIFLCLSVNHFGRRAMLLLSAIITGLSSLLLLALTQYLQGGLVLVLSIVGLLFSQALAMLSAFFASEVMPTVVRGGCLGLVLASGCVGMAASSLMELQNNSGYFLHHVIFASFAVLSVLCIMLLPESKRKPLPDSMKDGESQRRPPLFLSQPGRDNLPLLVSVLRGGGTKCH
uniref:Solute carrier family 22 member 31 n=1 Tax=Gouania willdenowi TaxID=441366 RepID=A0A8C5DLT1_GOUWI